MKLDSLHTDSNVIVVAIASDGQNAVRLEMTPHNVLYQIRHTTQCAVLDTPHNVLY